MLHSTGLPLQYEKMIHCEITFISLLDTNPI